MDRHRKRATCVLYSLTVDWLTSPSPHNVKSTWHKRPQNIRMWVKIWSYKNVLRIYPDVCIRNHLQIGVQALHSMQNTRDDSTAWPSPPPPSSGSRGQEKSRSFVWSRPSWRRVDQLSLVVLPGCFLLFNLVYWWWFLKGSEAAMPDLDSNNITTPKQWRTNTYIGRKSRWKSIILYLFIYVYNHDS